MSQQTDQVLQALVDLVQGSIVAVADLDAESVEPDTFLFPEIADEIGVDPRILNLRTNEEVSLDSLDMLDIIVAIESKLGVRFDLEEETESGTITPADFASPALVAGFLKQRLDPAVIEAWLAKQS